MTEKTGSTKTNPNAFLSLIVHHFEPSVPGGKSTRDERTMVVKIDVNKVVNNDTTNKTNHLKLFRTLEKNKIY